MTTFLWLTAVAFSNHPRLHRFHVDQQVNCKQKASQWKLFQKLCSSTHLPVKALTEKNCELIPRAQCMTLRSFTPALQSCCVAFMPHFSHGLKPQYLRETANDLCLDYFFIFEQIIMTIKTSPERWLGLAD